MKNIDMKTIEIKIEELTNRVTSLEDNMKIKDEQIEELLQDNIAQDVKLAEQDVKLAEQSTEISKLTVFKDYCQLFYNDLKDVVGGVHKAKRIAMGNLLRAAKNEPSLED